MTPVFQAQCFTPYSFQPALFPDNAYLFYSPGMISSEDGICLCPDPFITTAEKCNNICLEFDKNFSSHPVAIDCKKTPRCKNEQGLGLLAQDGVIYAYGINPKKKENYKKALTFVNENLLIPNYFEKETEAIIQDFKKIHAILLDQVVPREELGDIGGTYRTSMASIFSEEFVSNLWHYLKGKIAENGGRDELLDAVDTLKLKYERYRDFDKAVNKASKLEKEALRLTELFFLEPDKIAEEMASFVDALREKVFDSTLPPAEVAAFAHTTLTQIHPFADGVGKFSRVIKDVVGFHKGLSFPTYFFDEDEYNEKSKEADQDPNIFIRYMQSSMEKTEEFMKKMLQKNAKPLNWF